MLNGKELRLIREVLDIKLSDVSIKMSVTPKCISDIELNKTDKKSTLILYNMIMLEMIRSSDYIKEFDKKIENLQNLKTKLMKEA